MDLRRPFVALALVSGLALASCASSGGNSLAAEWNDDLGHAEGARLVPLPELGGRLDELAEWKDKPVLTVCRVGARSRSAADLLPHAGFADISNLEGGMAAWRRAGF